MSVQYLGEQKKWVIGHKIADIEVKENAVYIKMDDEKTICIELVKNVGLVPSKGIRHTIWFEARLLHQVAIPAKTPTKEVEQSKS